MCEFTAKVVFDKATNGQTGIKYDTGKTLSSMSLLKIVGEELPPSQRSSLENKTKQKSKAEMTAIAFKKTNQNTQACKL